LRNKKIAIQNKQFYLSILATVITILPLIIGIWTVTYNLKKQAEISENIKEQEAKTTFKLKTLEMILESESTEAAKVRAKALRQLFPESIDEKFVEAFNDSEFKLPGIAYQEKKAELFKMLSSKLEAREEVFKTYCLFYADEKSTVKTFAENWKKVYPHDNKLIDELLQNLNIS
jgi:hypothetical protein